MKLQASKDQHNVTDCRVATPALIQAQLLDVTLYPVRQGEPASAMILPLAKNNRGADRAGCAHRPPHAKLTTTYAASPAS